MTVKYNKNLVGAGFFSVLSLIIWLMIPYQIVLKNDRVINSQTFPRVVVGLMVICSLYLLIREIISIIKKEEHEYMVIQLKEEVKSLLMIGAVVLFWIMLHWINFAASASVFSVLALLIFRCRKWKYYAIVFLVIIVVTYVFETVLHVNLP